MLTIEESIHEEGKHCTIHSVTQFSKLVYYVLTNGTEQCRTEQCSTKSTQREWTRVTDTTPNSGKTNETEPSLNRTAIEGDLD